MFFCNTWAEIQVFGVLFSATVRLQETGYRRSKAQEKRVKQREVPLAGWKTRPTLITNAKLGTDTKWN